MIVWGGAALAVALGARLPQGIAPRFLHTRMGAVLRAVHAQPPVVRALAVGLVTTLLPCGWLWVYVATAAGTASIPAAALVMAAFWLGTVPMMAGLGIAAQRLFGPLRRRLPVFTAAVLVVLGLLTVGGRFHAVPASGGHCSQCAPPEAHVGH
jgi:sulfite exporter TauE/SafE